MVGTAGSVLIGEASFIQRYICTQLYVVWTADSVQIREVSLIQSVLCRAIPLYPNSNFSIHPSPPQNHPPCHLASFPHEVPAPYQWVGR